MHVRRAFLSAVLVCLGFFALVTVAAASSATSPELRLPAIAASSSAAIEDTWRSVTSPVTRALVAIALTDPNNGWAVGDGVILRLRDGVWSVATSPTHALLTSIALSDIDNGWAVGTDGTILHLTNGVWQDASLVNYYDILYDVALSGPNDGWATTRWGSIVRLSHGVWSVTPTPTNHQWYTVAARASDDAWLAGQFAVIGRLSGERCLWSGEPASSTHDFSSIALSGPDTGWIVGSQGITVRLENGTCREVTSPTAMTLTRVALTDSDNGWAVGYNGTIIQLKQGVWSKAASPTTQSLSGVAVSGADAWAVGYGGVILHRGGSVVSGRVTTAGNGPLAGVTVMDEQGHSAVTDADGQYTLRELEGGEHTLIAALPGYVFTPASHTIVVPPGASSLDFVANQARTVSLPYIALASRPDQPPGVWRPASSPTRNDLNAIALSSPNEGWAVGQFGTILRLHEGEWSEAVVRTRISATLNAIALSGPNDGWAVGEHGAMVQLSNGVWDQGPALTIFGLYAVVLNDANNGWATTSVGDILRLTDGAWSKVDNPDFWRPYALALSGPEDGWATQLDSTLLKLRHGHWSQATDFYPNAGQLRAIALSGSDDGWAVGDGIVRLQQGVWTFASYRTGLAAIALTGPDEGWAVGYSAILRLHRGVWSETENPPSDFLNGVAFNGTDHGWAVGRKGIIYRYAVPAP